MGHRALYDSSKLLGVLLLWASPSGFSLNVLVPIGLEAMSFPLPAAVASAGLAELWSRTCNEASAKGYGPVFCCCEKPPAAASEMVRLRHRVRLCLGTGCWSRLLAASAAPSASAPGVTAWKCAQLRTHGHKSAIIHHTPFPKADREAASPPFFLLVQK